MEHQAEESSHECSSELSSSLQLRHSRAIESLHRSRQSLRSCAAAFKARSDSSSNDRSEYSSLLKEFGECVHNLEKENWQLSLQLENMRQDLGRLRERTTRGKTLRDIISVRLIEPTEESISDSGPQNTPIAESESLDPFPASILDVALSSRQLEIVEELLPKISELKNRQIYFGLCIRTCIFCRKPKFYMMEDHISSIFRNLVEFPLLNPRREDDSRPYGEVCSSCLFKILLRDICRNWWQNLGAFLWLKPHCSRGCCVDESIFYADCLRTHLLQFRSIDQANREKCVSW